ncbi:MAG: hypothetical protein HOY76_36360, partial [Streptomyces sp.]|nr:hypothetical protein [Streptomyces sp.]
ARWLANSGHPLPGRAAGGRGWSPVTTATFDLLVAARGADLDLVVLRAQED